MKMPTIVDIFIYISRENFMLSSVEHEKSFITSGLALHCLPGLSDRLVRINTDIYCNCINVRGDKYSRFYNFRHLHCYSNSRLVNWP